MKKHPSSILAAAVFMSFVGCTSLKYGVKSTSYEETLDIKLPTTVIPLRYELSLWTDPKLAHFTGQVGIELELVENRQDIVLHAQDLKILSAVIQGQDGEQEGQYSIVDGDSLARITFKQELKKGLYRLEVGYEGKYSNDLSGLYRIKDGDEYYLYTQFEPLAARKMLPCFDEPRFKTPFDIKVTTSTGQIVIANSSVKSEFEQNDEKVYIFDTTKPMSSYLLALAVGPFDVVTGPSLKSNRYRLHEVPFRGIATKGKGTKLSLALNETPLILEKLEDYFGVAYPFDKLDILAVPDFSAGAMENIGAITFREWYLLLDELTASVKQKRDFYLVMAHELSHQWFGNSVTMPWWDDLWLNEAFATWLSYKIVDQVKPQFKSAAHLLERAHKTMAVDSLLSARRIREPIKSNHDIHNAFDSITYSKGGAVLSMLENYLGSEQFREAVSFHIKTFQYGTASSQDFLQSLAKFSDGNLVASAETFLNQAGLPLVKLSYNCDDQGVNVAVSQKRYVPIGSKVNPAGHWHIPMCIGYESSTEIKKHCFTLDQESASIKINQKKCPAFIIPNWAGQGYYRFALDKEAYQSLLGLKPNLIHENDRLAIADSLIGQFYAGDLVFGDVAEHLFNMVDINSSLLTSYFMDFIEEAHHHWLDEENRPFMVTYAKDKIRGIYVALNQETLTDDQKLMKKPLAHFLADVLKDRETRLELSIIGNSYLQAALAEKIDNDEPIISDENLLSDALGVTMQYQDGKDIAKVIEKLSSITDTVMRSHLLFGLAKSREGSAALDVRSVVFNKNLRKNEQLRWFYDHLKNPQNQPYTWSFLKDNFSQFKSVLSNEQMANLPYLAEGLCSNESADEVNKYFAPFIAKYKGGPRNLTEVVEQIEICAARRTYATALANSFFKAQQDQAVVEKK